MTELLHVADVKSDPEVVLAFGHFSVIHPGHMRYLQRAKSSGRRLVVGVADDAIVDGKSKYPFKQVDRATALRSLDIVDSVVLLDEDGLRKLVDALNPESLFLGVEFEYTKDLGILAAIDTQRNSGRRVIFSAGDIHSSNIEYLTSSDSDLARNRKEKFKLALARQEISIADLDLAINKFCEAKVAVVGDLIVDTYIACDALGMSAEAPVIVVKELERRQYLGGASIVAAHIQALGAQCCLASVVGSDETGLFAADHLSQLGVDARLIRDTSRPTTNKTRYMVENQKLFRVSRLDESKLGYAVEQALIDQIEDITDSVDVLVVCDFVYGVITSGVLEKIKDIALRKNILLIGDVQCSSQVGSITDLVSFDLLCPNEREARVGLKDKDSGLDGLAQKIVEEADCKSLIMKLGGDGFIVYQDLAGTKPLREVFPALNTNPADVTGAGDSLLATLAVGLASGCNLMVTAALGSCMTSLAVGAIGNVPITRETLNEKVQALMVSDHKHGSSMDLP